MPRRRLLLASTATATFAAFLGLGAVSAAGMHADMSGSPSAEPTVQLTAFPAPKAPAAASPGRAETDAPHGLRQRERRPLGLGNAAGPVALGLIGLGMMTIRRR